jgi:hypothetical protein
MARTVVAIYENFQTANNAVRELVDNGFPRESISIIANNSRGDYNAYEAGKTSGEGKPVADETGAGAGVGAGIGAAIGGIGGLLVGLGALTIPGIGPVIAAGPLAVALSTLTGAGVGAVAGGVTGGLLGALIGLGVPEDEAEYYAEGVRRGGVLVTVQADEYNANQITDILNHFNPLNIDERATHWREQGWKGFDPDARPLSEEEMEMERSRWQIANTGTTASRDDTVEINREYPSTRMTFDPQSNYYRTHYNTYFFDSGNAYDAYVPAYQYGYELRSDQRYRGRRWEEIEPNVRSDWEIRQPGTWERFKSAVRHAWEEITD